MYVEKLKSEEDITIEDTINKYSKYFGYKRFKEK